MTHFGFLDGEIFFVELRRRNDNRHAFGYRQAVAFKSCAFGGIVRQQANRCQTQVRQNLRADTVITQVGLESEQNICFDSVFARVLKCVGREYEIGASGFPSRIVARSLAATCFGRHAFMASSEKTSSPYPFIFVSLIYRSFLCVVIPRRCPATGRRMQRRAAQKLRRTHRPSRSVLRRSCPRRVCSFLLRHPLPDLLRP